MSIQDMLRDQPELVRCNLRTGRAGRSGVVWSEWREAALHLQRTKAGSVCALNVTGEDFAEFDPRHHDEGAGLLVSEGYYLEVRHVLTPR